MYNICSHHLEDALIKPLFQQIHFLVFIRGEVDPQQCSELTFGSSENSLLAIHRETDVLVEIELDLATCKGSALHTVVALMPSFHLLSNSYPCRAGGCSHGGLGQHRMELSYTIVPLGLLIADWCDAISDSTDQVLQGSGVSSAISKSSGLLCVARD